MSLASSFSIRWVLLLALGFSFTASAFDTVVIDAGHGGKDPGSIWKPLVEKTLCLDVATRLEKALKAKGFKTVMTRTDDTFVELSDRAAIANKHPGSVFVSIHFNANVARTPRGYEVHYRSDNGKLLAESVVESMKKTVNARNRGVSFEDYKVLRETTGTSVLVECGFISNKVEAEECNSWKHRQSIADAIAVGLAAMKDKL
jgi:N-acetylmuramoyl-L-alanine amidase